MAENNINSYKDLRAHVGHTLACIAFGDPEKPASVTIECQTCGELLLDYDRPEYRIGDEDNLGDPAPISATPTQEDRNP